MRNLWAALAALVTLSLAGCGYNTLQSNDQQIKASWSEVVNEYQRRADLIPNLVNTVKGFAAQEKDVLLGVTNASAKVGGIQATPELINSPEAFAKFQAAQGELSGALSRLLVVSSKVGSPEWEKICRTMETAFNHANYAGGMVSGIEAVTQHLIKHFPASGAGPNELPDKPMVL